MKPTTPKRNQPIATLIKQFIDKKSGKVSVARTEIKRRFLYLDWKDQKKIVMAFLDSTMTDRQWMYVRLLDLWDESFESKVIQLWEEYHEERCAWVVIRHLPKEYVLSQLDFFRGKRDYYFVCRRFYDEPDFLIDPERFKDRPNDYLHLLTLKGAMLDEAEGERILFGMLYDMCESLSSWHSLTLRGVKRNEVPSALSFPEISLAVYNLRKLWCIHTVNKFETWNANVQKELGDSPQYQKLLHFACSDDEFMVHLSTILLEVMYSNLDVDPKSPVSPTPDKGKIINAEALKAANNISRDEYEDWFSDNPALEALAQEFDLEYIGEDKDV